MIKFYYQKGNRKGGLRDPMVIKYKDRTAEEQFSSKYKKRWQYPEAVKTRLVATENYIDQADSLLDIVQYPSYRFHPLRGDRKGEWSISLGKTGYRVTVIPCDEHGKQILSGDIVAQCKSIRIIEVTEVSNHYE